MNKHFYRVIFSKTLQRLVVVSDITPSEGKAKSEGGSHATLFAKIGAWSLKPLMVGLYGLLGAILVPAQAQELQIRADNTAPTNQRPIILETANGLPQVNIQTPNDKGMSYNKYQQFDVDTRGAILNNSRKNVQTEIGGWVQANPYLAGGEAKLIVNEVNAARPSQLKGYLEVAGQKADVIVANPSGIHCEGCGFINSGRATLTTGQVQIENGWVSGYQVEKGTISVSGRGMDTSRQDYTDIIAKEVKVNVGIWANNLKVTTGKNKVSKNNESVQVIQAGDETAQPVGYAVDVAELGGMYAGQIHLVGTENGLGVRNAGHIGASAGEVRITTEGQLVNAGYIGAQQDATIHAKQAVANQASGVMYTQSGDITITSQQQGIEQHGSLIAKGKAQGKGNIQLSAKETITQTKDSLAEGNIRYQAKRIEASENSRIAAGVNFNPTETTEDKQLETLSDGGRTVHLSVEQDVQGHGQYLASGSLLIEATAMNLSGSQINANQLSLQAREGDIQLDKSDILVNKTAVLQTPTTLSTAGAALSAEHFLVTARFLNNQQGYWQQTGEESLVLSLNQGLNNQQGVLRTLGELVYQGATFNNQQGLVTTPKTLTINANAQEINNQSGLLLAQQTLQLNAGVLSNQQGVIQSPQNVSIVVPTVLNQQGGKILSAQQLTLDAQSIDNQSSFIQANQATITASQQLDNHAVSTQGSLIRATDLRITAPVVLNQHTKASGETPTQGIIADQIVVKSDQWSNQSGGIYAGRRFEGEVAQQFANQQGELLSLGTLALQGNNLQLDNQHGVIQSHGDLSLGLTQWENIGQVSTASDATITMAKDFRLDTPIVVDGTLQLNVANQFINQTPLVIGQSLVLKAQSIENQVNAELSSQQTEIQSVSLVNRGLIDGNKNTIVTQRLDNVGSGRIYGDELAIQAKVLNNLEEQDQAGTIAARNRLDLGVGTLTNYSHALVLSQGDLHIGGYLDAQQHAAGQADFVDNGSATIEALGDGYINTNRLWNHDLYLRTGIHTDKEHFEEYAQATNSIRYRQHVEGELDWNRKSRKAWFAFYDGRRSSSQNDWFGWEYTRTTDTTTIEQRDPGKILVAGNLSLNGNYLHNQYSQILVGRTLTLGNQIFADNSLNKNLSGNNVQLVNEDLIGDIYRRDDGVSFQMVAYKDGNPIRPRYGHKRTRDTAYHHEHPVEHFYFGIVDNTIGQNVATSGTPINPQTAAQQAQLNGLNVDLTQGSRFSEIPHVRAVMPNRLLPQASLYRLNLSPDSHVLVETDPQFTNKRKWLSSDYMFTALRSDPQMVLKRLGDGYYEQRLVNEQINQLTGRRFLDNYTSDYEQYKALMDAGIRYAKQFNLIPGVSLSAEQMQVLTEDMVWLVPQTVALKDGTTVQVLVPQVYLVKRDVDVRPTGAVISAQDIKINLAGDIRNSGVIAGRNLTQISAQNMENYGDLVAGQLAMRLANHYYQQGGNITADNLHINADTIHIESRLSESQDTGDFYRRQLDQQATIRVNDSLVLASQADMALNASKISAGNASLYAGGRLMLGTQSEENKEHYVSDANNYWKLDQHNEIATDLDVKGAATLVARQDVSLRGTHIEAKDGVAVVSQEGDIHIDAARQQEQLSSGLKYTEDGLLKSKTITIRHDHAYDVAQGAQLSGKDVLLVANQGDITVKGSHVVADQDVVLQAQDIDVSAEKNTSKVHDFYAKKESGLLSSGGIGFTIGSRSEKHDYKDTEITQSDARATIGSLGGDVRIVAGNHANILGTDLIAQPDKSIDVTAKTLKVEAGKDIIESTEDHEFKQSGLTVALSSPVTDMAMRARDSITRSRQVQDSRLKALYEIKAAQEGILAVREASKVAQAAQSGKSSDFKVSVTVGEQKSESHSRTTQVIHQGSTLSAGNVNLTTTEGDLDIIGSSIKAGNASLDAAGNLNLLSAQDTMSNRSDNKNSGWSAGVFVGYSGGSYGFGVEGSAQVGKGHENSDSVTQVNTTVQANNATLRSGQDTNLKGATVTADSIRADVGRNLTIESRQDEQHYNSKQVQAGVSASVAIYGSGSNASVNANLNKGKLNYAQVETQSGLQAGKEGLDVTVQGNTHLKGGIIDSQATADKNHFSTGTLSAEDIHNYSEVKVQNIGGGFSTDMSQNMANGAAAGLNALGNVNKSDSSTTSSAIGGNIQLNVKEGGVPDNLSRDTQNANAKTERFDMTEVRERQEMAQVIGEIANNGIAIVLKPRLDEAEEDKREAEARLKENRNDIEAEAKRVLADNVIAEYGQGGYIQTAVRAVTGVLQGIATGSANQAVVGGLSPYANKIIGEVTKGDRAANLTAHALLGAVEAYATGNHAGAGAAGAVTGELAAKIITKQLYGKDSSSELTEAQKQTVTALSQLASGLAGGLVGDSTSSAISAAEIGKRAVENNYLSDWQEETRRQELENCQGSWGCEVRTKIYWQAIDTGQDVTFVSGMLIGVPESLYDTVNDFVSIIANPGEIIKTLKLLVSQDDMFSKIAEGIKQDYLARLDNFENEYERAGAGGSFNAGREVGKFISELVFMVATDGTTTAAKTVTTGLKTAIKLGREVASKAVGKQGVAHRVADEIIHKVDVPDKVVSDVKTSANEVKTASVEPQKQPVCGIAGSACFVAGTLVETSNGLKPIEQIQYGELVWAREEFGYQYDYKPVLANSVTEKQATVEILVQNKAGDKETFTATTEHPFFVEGQGWLKASLLEEGMILVDRNGEPSITVLSQQSTGKLETVYNIKVEDFSTYHIGHLGVWVHNTQCCDFNQIYIEPLKEAGWVNKDGLVEYIDPFDGVRKLFPDEATPSVDHILPQRAFEDIPGFELLPKDVQRSLINDPMNLQPMPKELNSSKGSKVEINGTNGWKIYVKEGKEISPLYQQYLEKRQNAVQDKVKKEIQRRGL